MNVIFNFVLKFTVHAYKDIKIYEKELCAKQS